MRTSRMGQLALVLTTAAIALAGCGGSSKNSSTTLGPSTPINSALYRNALEAKLAKIPGLPSSDIPKIVSCAVRKLESQGITTVGAVPSHRSEANADGQSCARALGLH